MQFTNGVIGTLCILLLTANAHAQTTRYVDDSAPAGGNGQSWATAFSNLQDALADAAANPSITDIHVAGGTYTPGTASGDTFAFANGTRLAGGYRGLAGGGDPDDRDIDAFTTTLSGNLGGPRSYHVITINDSVQSGTLDGFTITGGRANGSSYPDYYGGGLYTRGSTCAIINCTFTGNEARTSGGGLYAFEAALEITDCDFLNNEVEYRGAGLYCQDTTVAVTGCRFELNEIDDHAPGEWDDAGAYGGGAYVRTGNPSFNRCTFLRNSVNAQASGDMSFATADGGGLCIENTSVTLESCAFFGNSATAGNMGIAESHGGGVSSDGGTVTLINCLFTGNTASVGSYFDLGIAHGGGLCHDSAIIRNCTFSRNAATRNGSNNAALGGAIQHHDGGLTLDNCILWGNTANTDPQVFGTATVRYSCVQGGWSGTGNTTGDPQFVDDDGPDNTVGTEDDNLRLTPGSPCMDSADADALSTQVNVDLDGYLRRMDEPGTPNNGAGAISYLDRGPYEYAGDCNNNGIPDGGDLLSGFSTDCQPNGIPDECDIALGLAADCNGNGTLDVCDIAAGTSEDCNTNGVPDECEGPAFFVDDDAPAGGDGTSWATAFNNLQDALALAGCNAPDIYVAGGTYKPGTTRQDTFMVSGDVAVRGGYRGLAGGGDPFDRDIAQFKTTLSGDLNGDDGPDWTNRTDNSYHIVSCTQDAVPITINGFTITGGHDDSNASSGPFPGSMGAGLTNLSNDQLAVSNCMFHDNAAVATSNGSMAAAMGGGMLTAGTVHCCTFINNTTEASGSGTDTVYSGGGALAATLGNVTNCRFVGNTSLATGGKPISLGGALMIGQATTGADDPLVINCAFVGNISGTGGAVGISGGHPEFINCTFSTNSATLYGGAISTIKTGAPIVRNCILWGNTAASGASIYSKETPTVTFSCIEGGWSGTGNTSVAPLFVDADGDDDIPGNEDDDIHIRFGSPCIDRGNHSYLPGDVAYDLDGDSRILDGDGDGLPAVDMGCDEHWTDCNDNGVMDAFDISAGTSVDWNEYWIPDECEDCNANGVPDFIEIAYGWVEDCNFNDLPDECDIANGDAEDCNLNGVPDACDIRDGESGDCNDNGIPDECDIANGTCVDSNGNSVPDVCEDCNSNGIPDNQDIQWGTSGDCNDNDIPDECDIANETSMDWNENGIPDECEPDCNHNGMPDFVDLMFGISTDCNGNTELDDCEPIGGGDFDADGDADMDDYHAMLSRFAGPNAWIGGPGDACVYVYLDAFDFDMDLDIDLADMAGFQIGFMRPRIAGDWNWDGVVTASDFVDGDGCFSGPYGGAEFALPPGRCRAVFDMDQDGDTDLPDFVAFQRLCAAP